MVVVQVVRDAEYYWERDKGGKQTYHNSWVTDLEVTAKNVSEVVEIGRAKWKVENEQFNVQKYGGYHLEHNYGHGEKTLSSVFYYLNLLAYITHVILDRGDQLFQHWRASISWREEMWNVSENDDELCRVGKLATDVGVYL